MNKLRNSVVVSTYKEHIAEIEGVLIALDTLITVAQKKELKRRLTYLRKVLKQHEEKE